MSTESSDMTGSVGSSESESRSDQLANSASSANAQADSASAVGAPDAGSAAAAATPAAPAATNAPTAAPAPATPSAPATTAAPRATTAPTATPPLTVIQWVPSDSPDGPHPEDTPQRLRVGSTVGDRVFRGTSYLAGAITVSIMAAAGLFLATNATKSLSMVGWGFFTIQEWSPETGQFGIAAVLFGTVVISLIAVIVAVPLSMGTSLFIAEIARGKVQRFLISMVDLLAAVPSVVFGLWGLFFLQGKVIPVSRWLNSVLGWIPIFAVTLGDDSDILSPSVFTSSAFIAGLVVGMMILPVMCSVMRESYAAAPPGEREGAYALGSTRWAMIRNVVLPFGKGGAIGGTMLGLGRALGETIAVEMIISPVFTIQPHILQTGTNSVAALIALRYNESGEIGLSALMAAGLALFLMTLVVNFSASMIVARSRSGAVSEA